MARVLTFDELAALPTGTHVWEDCMWSTAPAEMVKLRTDNQRGRKRVFGCYSGEKGELRFSADFDFRYQRAYQKTEKRREYKREYMREYMREYYKRHKKAVKSDEPDRG